MARDLQHGFKNPGVRDSTRLNLFFHHLAPCLLEVDVLAGPSGRCGLIRRRGTTRRVQSNHEERPLVPLLHLVVRRHSTMDDGLLIRRQVHDRNLTVLPAAAADSDQSRTHDFMLRWREAVGDERLGRPTCPLECDDLLKKRLKKPNRRSTKGVSGHSQTHPEGGATEPPRLIVVTNWFEELRQRMGN